MKILLVEDNEVLSKSVVEGLCVANETFEIETAFNGEDAIYEAQKNIYDIIILDIMLPDMNGIDVLNKIRKISQVPVIMLTAKEDINDKIGAFDKGANDYITKPFYMEELVARIYALLRTSKIIDKENILSFRNLNLNLSSRKVYLNNEEVGIFKKQFDILEYFLVNKGQILMKEQIYDRIWGIESDTPLEIVEVNISGLRKKLKDYSKYIKTKRGVGYIFEDE